jgi:hypothetical protein
MLTLAARVFEDTMISSSGIVLKMKSSSSTTARGRVCPQFKTRSYQCMLRDVDMISPLNMVLQLLQVGMVPLVGIALKLSKMLPLGVVLLKEIVLALRMARGLLEKGAAIHLDGSWLVDRRIASSLLVVSLRR